MSDLTRLTPRFVSAEVNGWRTSSHKWYVADRHYPNYGAYSQRYYLDEMDANREATRLNRLVERGTR